MKSSSPEAIAFDGPAKNESPIQPSVHLETQGVEVAVDSTNTEVASVESVSNKSIEEMLAAMSPEARENAEEIFREMAAPAVASEVLLVSSEATTGAEASVDQVAAQPNSTELVAETEPRRISADEAASINENLHNFSVDSAPNPNFVSTALDHSVTAVSGGERPISGRRVSVEMPTTSNDVDAALVAKLTNGRLNRLANRIEGARELRADRKHIIAVQKESLDKAVKVAREAKRSARRNRIVAITGNNVLARAFGNRASDRTKLKNEIRDKAFGAIDEARRIKNEKRNRDPAATSATDNLRKTGVRMKAWNEARREIRDVSREAMRTARESVTTAKDKLDSKKSTRSSLNFKPYRRRTSIAGQSAGLRSAYSEAGSYLSMSEESKRIREKQRAEAFMKAQKARLAAQAKKATDKRR